MVVDHRCCLRAETHRGSRGLPDSVRGTGQVTPHHQVLAARGDMLSWSISLGGAAGEMGSSIKSSLLRFLCSRENADSFFCLNLTFGRTNKTFCSNVYIYIYIFGHFFERKEYIYTWYSMWFVHVRDVG